jgi:quinol-cytochrome oxidoreductase complex cytochrome b subunit
MINKKFLFWFVSSTIASVMAVSIRSSLQTAGTLPKWFFMGMYSVMQASNIVSALCMVMIAYLIVKGDFF